MVAPKVTKRATTPPHGESLLAIDENPLRLADEIRQQVRTRIERELPRVIRERVLNRFDL